MSYRTRDQRIADEATENLAPCSFCGKHTQLSTLGQYGARCWPCFEAYCHEIPSKDHYTVAEKRQILSKLRAIVAGSQLRDQKAWAHDLRKREEGGERLSSMQRTMWRAALLLETREAA